jgi:GNAT superfamily N-acetyltransferase
LILSRWLVDPVLARRIEDASLRAWPALEVQSLDGWELRSSAGFTKRANSVQPLGPSTQPLSEKVAGCEAWYAARDLPTIFRLTSFSDPNLDSFLESRAYEVIDLTDVLYTRLPLAEAYPANADIAELSLDDWVATYGVLSGADESTLTPMRGILDACQEARFLAALSSESSRDLIACGLAVLETDVLGIFDVVTALPHRRRGYGAGLVGGLVGWGLARGADYAYLQVVKTNAPALALYRKLGFAQAYEYWYRIRAGAG